jgi:hypothetical protein
MDNNKCIVGGKTAFVAFAVLLMTTVYSAMANPLVQQHDFNGIHNFSRTLTFNKSSEALTSVSISLNLQINGGTLIIDNDGDSNISGTLKFGISGNANSTEVNLPSLFGTNVFYSQPFYLDSNENDVKGDYSPLPPDGMQFIGSSNSGNISTLVEDTFFNDYIGTGTYNITIGIASLADFGNLDLNNVEYTIIAPVYTNGYVEVTYTCIPEPATITLLTFGVFAVLKRKRNKQHSLQIS